MMVTVKLEFLSVQDINNDRHHAKVNLIPIDKGYRLIVRDFGAVSATNSPGSSITRDLASFMYFTDWWRG
jgi:hypothetical protein